MKKLMIFTLIAMVSGFFIVGPNYAAEPIKFGFLHSLSGGVGQVYGIPDQEAVKIAVEEINKAGGILGRPLEMIVRDDKLNPENAVREAKDLDPESKGPVDPGDRQQCRGPGRFGLLQGSQSSFYNHYRPIGGHHRGKRPSVCLSDQHQYRHLHPFHGQCRGQNLGRQKGVHHRSRL